MQVFGKLWNEEPKTTEIYVVAELDRNFGNDKYYAYFINEEKAQAWLDKHNSDLGGRLEIAKILVS